MTNTLNKLSAAFLERIGNYAFGCVCYNQMGMSPAESDTFTQWLLAPTPVAELDENSAENHTNQPGTRPNRLQTVRTA
jgi:hypothetical protein